MSKKLPVNFCRVTDPRYDHIFYLYSDQKIEEEKIKLKYIGDFMARQKAKLPVVVGLAIEKDGSMRQCDLPLPDEEERE